MPALISKARTLGGFRRHLVTDAADAPCCCGGGGPPPPGCCRVVRILNPCTDQIDPAICCTCGIRWRTSVNHSFVYSGQSDEITQNQSGLWFRATLSMRHEVNIDATIIHDCRQQIPSSIVGIQVHRFQLSSRLTDTSTDYVGRVTPQQVVEVNYDRNALPPMDGVFEYLPGDDLGNQVLSWLNLVVFCGTSVQNHRDQIDTNIDRLWRYAYALIDPNTPEGFLLNRWLGAGVSPPRGLLAWFAAPGECNPTTPMPLESWPSLDGRIAEVDNYFRTFGYDHSCQNSGYRLNNTFSLRSFIANDPPIIGQIGLQADTGSTRFIEIPCVPNPCPPQPVPLSIADANRLVGEAIGRLG